MFPIAGITDAGKAAMQLALDEGYPLIFTSIKTGSGIYEEEEEIKERTALKVLKNTYPIGSKEETASGITLGAVFTNYSNSQVVVADDYRINEIGVFCTVNGTEYLYALGAEIGDTGMEMPGYDGSNLTQIIQKWFVTYTNDAVIEVDMSGAFAIAEDLETETEERIEADFLNLYGLCTKTTTIAIVSGNKQITESGDGVTAVTTIVKTSDTQKNITTVITPTEGDYFYTKTTVITKTSGGKTITESYTRSLKPQQVSE